MLTVAEFDSPSDTAVPGVTESLVECALACVAPEDATGAERADAIYHIARAIRHGRDLLTEQDRRELATALLEGLPTRDPHALVLEFHQVFGLPVNDRSRTVDELRAKLIREEAEEAAEAIESGDQEHVAKELADLIIVTEGTAITHGIDLAGAVLEVHRSNMTKLVDGKPMMRPDGKVLKGPNYRPPNMSAYVPGRP